jgi:hypothetical protein
LAGSDPATAAQWAETIGNEDSRNVQIETIVRNWMSIDSNKAVAWINASSLSAEVKARLMSTQ